MKLRTLFIGLAAISVAASAAFFSVSGLSKLFAGASLSVTIMAASLEFSKLLAASFLHTYWKRIGILLRIYLTLGVIVLILITSLGIYGFLTSAYQVTADELTMLNKEVGIIELKKKRFEDQLNIYNVERTDLNTSISDLSKGISNNVIQYTDKFGNLVSTQSSSNRIALEKQLNDAKIRRNEISNKIDALVDSIASLDVSIIETQNSTSVAAEIGPLRYLAEVTGLPMSTIVNWFTLLIVFVFDPLAVSLLIAYNAAVKFDREGTGYDIKTEKTPMQRSNQFTWFKRKGDTDASSAHDDGKIVNELHAAIDTDTLSVRDANDDTSGQGSINFDAIMSNDNISADESLTPIDVDDDGLVDGYDSDGDGDVDVLIKNPYNDATLNTAEPHYTDPNFDWSDRKKWINNQNAINYYLNHVKNKK